MSTTIVVLIPGTTASTPLGSLGFEGWPVGARLRKLRDVGELLLYESSEIGAKKPRISDYENGNVHPRGRNAR